MELIQFSVAHACLLRLLLQPGPGPWTQTLKNLDPQEPGPWKTWETAGYGKMIRRPHITTY